MPLSTVILLFNDQLTLRLSEALNLTLKLIKAVNNICLHTSHFLLQVSDERVHPLLCRQIYLAVSNLVLRPLLSLASPSFHPYRSGFRILLQLGLIVGIIVFIHRICGYSCSLRRNIIKGCGSLRALPWHCEKFIL